MRRLSFILLFMVLAGHFYAQEKVLLYSHYSFNGLALNIGIANGLGNARKLLDDVRSGKSTFHAIEVMACPGGCIGGGGQPWHHGNSEIIKARASAIYTEDRKKPLRKSHENPFIIKLYEEFLEKPNSEKAHHLLHTHYFEKKKKIIIKQ